MYFAPRQRLGAAVIITEFIEIVASVSRHQLCAGNAPLLAAHAPADG